MTRLLCRALIWAAAAVAPSVLRDRWREEWLGELDASASSVGLLRRCLGAPWDALSLRWTTKPPAGAASGRTGAHWWAGASRDLHHAVKQVRRQPGNASTIVLCLAIGLAVAVSAFSLINALVFADLPGMSDRTSLLRVFVGYDGVFGTEGLGRGQTAAAGPLSISDFRLLDVPHASLAGLASEGASTFTLALGTDVVSARGAFVSARYFDVLGTAPAAGRLLGRADADAGAPPAVVIGFHLWQGRFQGRPDLVNRSVLIGGRAFAVVGIAPSRFNGIQPADLGQNPIDLVQVWVPDRFAASWPGVPAAEAPWLSVVGRLAPGATRDEARADLETAAARLSDAQPAARGHAHVVMRSHGLSTADGVGFVLLVVSLCMTLPLTVLAIGCANVANLQLARATERARELTVRLALGATRGQLVRLLSVEVLGLALLSAVLGWAGAKGVLAAAATQFPLPVPLDRRVFFFACGLVLAVTTMSGIAPAWLATRRATAAGLKQTPQTGGLAHSRLRSALVATQVALSLVLLFVAALSVRSLHEQLAAVPAVSRELVTAEISLAPLGYTSARARDLSDHVIATLRADSRVQAAAIAEVANAVRYWRQGDDTIRRYAGGGAVGPGWFSTVDVRAVAGRVLDASDDGKPVAVISEGLASDMWPSSPAIGQSMRVQRSAESPPEFVDVVGVVADRWISPDGTPARSVYLPMREDRPAAFSLIVRTRDPLAVVPDIRAALLREDSRLPWIAVGTEADRLSGTLVGLRYVLSLFSLLSALALGLASAGLYAVMGYTVSLRRRELAVRLALGAQRSDLVSLVLWHSVRLVVIGGAIGFGLAIPLALAMRSQLVGVSPVEPLAVLPTLAVLLVVALGAGVVPARRAASVDPLTALKEH